MATERVPQRLWHVSGWALRLVTAGALAVSAFVHDDLADRYQLNRSGGMSQVELFQVEAGVAALAALLVLLSARCLVSAFAFGVAASAFAAVPINANYDIGALGPIPDMYEPLWYPEKTLTAVFEAAAASTALLGLSHGDGRRANPTKPARDSAASPPPSSVATAALALIKILRS
jgi:hypothetical protein